MNQCRTLDDFRRGLYLDVWAGEAQALYILWGFNKFLRLDEALLWLVANKITGKKFISWFQEDMGGSHLMSMSFMLKKIEHEKKLRPVLLGKDFGR